jgi:membrane associated rhomboid family serine protease
MSFFGSSSGVSIPPVVKNIIIINIVIFVITWIANDVLMNTFMTDHLALYSIKSEKFAPHQFITHMFMHANFMHIFFNMFGVFMFGRVLEQLWGSKKMLIFYTVTGLGAAAIHLTINYFQMDRLTDMVTAFNNAPSYTLFNDIVQKYYPVRLGSELTIFMQEWFYTPENSAFIPQAKEVLNDLVQYSLDIPTVGASGAVFGLLIAFAMTFPDAELMMIFLPIPIKAKYFVPFYALLELFFGVASFQWDNVAHFAHLGGALFGFLLVKWWKRNQFRIY